MNTTREYSYLDILAAREIGPEAVNEASLSRVWQHTQKAGKTSFGIVTAFRGGFSYKENRARNASLIQEIRSAGLGFFPMVGHWQECSDTKIPWQECPKDLLTDVTEDSLFIPGVPLDLIDRLGKKYDQDAWVYSGPETEGNVSLRGKTGQIMDLGKFHPNRIAQSYSKLKGSRTYTFESRAGGFMEGLIERGSRENPFPALQERVKELRREMADLI